MNLLAPALAAPRAVAQLLDAVGSLATDVRTIRLGLDPVPGHVASLQADVTVLRREVRGLRNELKGLTGQLDEVLDRMPDMKPGDEDDGLLTKAKDALAGPT